MGKTELFCHYINYFPTTIQFQYFIPNPDFRQAALNAVRHGTCFFEAAYQLSQHVENLCTNSPFKCEAVKHYFNTRYNFVLFSFHFRKYFERARMQKKHQNAPSLYYQLYFLCCKQGACNTPRQIVMHWLSRPGALPVLKLRFNLSKHKLRSTLLCMDWTLCIFQAALDQQDYATGGAGAVSAKLPYEQRIA